MTDMGKSEYREEQIIGFPQQVEAGVALKDMFRTHGFSGASVYKWRAKYGGKNASEAKLLKERACRGRSTLITVASTSSAAAAESNPLNRGDIKHPHMLRSTAQHTIHVETRSILIPWLHSYGHA